MQNQYNLARAQQSYKSLVQIHEKNGECFLSPVSYRVHYRPCLLKPNPSHASKLRKIGALTAVYVPSMDSHYMHVVHIITLTLCDWCVGDLRIYIYTLILLYITLLHRFKTINPH